MQHHLRYLKTALLFILTLGSLTLLNAQGLDLEWAKGMGSNGSDQGFSTAVDKAGNMYVAGFFNATVDFNPGSGTGSLTSSGGFDVFLAKYDAGGRYLWAKDIGGSGTDYNYGIAVDTAGNVYITGYFESAASFDAGNNAARLTAGGDDAYLAKYDANGNYQWAKKMGGTGTDWGMAVALDAVGNVYVTGQFNSPTADFNFGSGGLNVLGTYDIFLAKYDASGNYQWAKNMGGSGAACYSYGLAVDNAGDACITGYFSGTADFNPGSGGTNALTATGGQDIFLAKYDANGNYVWAENMKGAGYNWGYGAVIDATGNIYITGLFNGTVNFDPKSGNGALSPVSGSNDIFLAKYDANGNYAWAKGIGGNGADVGRGAALDRTGNVYITGYFQQLVDFNPGAGTDTLRSAGGNDIFIAKYDTGGNHVWAERMGNSDPDQGNSIAVSASGSMYVTGYFNKTVDFDPGQGTDTIASMGGYDIFILKLACNDTSSAYLKISACAESYILNGITYKESGTYTQMLTNVAGCDSTIILDLTLSQMDQPVIDVDGFTLGVDGTYATYQWLKNDMLIPGATGDTYTVTENGDYKVIVTNGEGCTDTSAAYTVTNYTGVKDMHAIAAQINIYPNPASNKINIVSPVALQVRITSIEGKMIKQQSETGTGIISLKELPAGMYLIHIADKEGKLIKVEKLVKN